MNKKILFGIAISCLVFCNYTVANVSNPKQIRLAVFDNPKPDPSKNENSQFLNSYMMGINTAITVAADKGIFITEKEFFHENNLASIIQQASNLKAWNPDVIIGLSTSNDFLMSKAFFSDQVILSISATDAAIANLPTGFYSLGIPDTNAVSTIIDFIHQHYPNSNLFITAAAESKESVDFADLLGKSYKSLNKEKRVTERKFLMEDINNSISPKFMSGYQKNDVIVVMAIGYDSAIDLMNKITMFLKPMKPIFITSIDNWGNSSTPQNMTGNYDAFRIDTLAGGEDTKNYKTFLKYFEKIYHAPPKDKISFITYQAVMSFVQASIQYPPSKNILNNKLKLLESYSNALKINPNWYRPPYCVVYKLENQNENFYQKIN